MAGVVGRFRSAAGVPLVGFVRLSPVGGAVSAGGESVAGVLRIPLGGDGWCRKVGLVASPGTQWLVEPLVTLDGYGVNYSPWRIQLVAGKVVDLFTGSVVEDDTSSVVGDAAPATGLTGTIVAPGVLEIELNATQMEGI